MGAVLGFLLVRSVLYRRMWWILLGHYSRVLDSNFRTLGGVGWRNVIGIWEDDAGIYW